MTEPKLYALPPGVDFAQELLAGLRARIDGPPEAMANVELYVNTERMARRFRNLFDQAPAGLLPRIRLVTDLDDPLTKAQLPQPIPPLRRRLEMVGLVSRLIDSQPDLAPRSALYDLADSLVGLMEEMHSEGVPPENLLALAFNGLVFFLYENSIVLISVPFGWRKLPHSRKPLPPWWLSSVRSCEKSSAPRAARPQVT